MKDQRWRKKRIRASRKKATTAIKELDRLFLDGRWAKVTKVTTKGERK